MDPIMQIINTRLSYKDRREVISIMTESSVMKDKVYSNIGKYFTKSITTQDTKALEPYLACKGNIVRDKNFKQYSEAIEFLKHDPSPNISKNALIIEEGLNNLKVRSKAFELGCKTKDNPVSKLLFAAVHKMCCGAISLLISDSSICGAPSAPKSYLPIEGLGLFNKYCKDGTVDKLMRVENFGDNKIAKEGLLDLPFAILTNLASAFITAIRSAVYWVFYTRMDIAEYLEQQATYIEMNKVRVNNRSDLSDTKKKEIIRKQTEWQNRLLKWSDAIQLDDVKAAKKAKEQAEKEEKEITAADAKGDTRDDDVPDFF